jgi:hypothetical protein
VTAISRFVIAAVAVVVCAWFAIGVRQAHEISAAANILNNASTERVPAVQRRAMSMLDAAAFLNPDTQVTLLRAQLAENAGDYARAARLINQATAAEPDNIEGWIASLKLGILDPSFGNGRLVFAQLHRLDPVDVYGPLPRRSPRSALSGTG